MKPGHKTSEFYLSSLAGAVGAIVSSGALDTADADIDTKIAGVVATAVAAVGYAIARAITKSAEIKAGLNKPSA